MSTAMSNLARSPYAIAKLDGVAAVEVERARADLAVDFDASKTTEQAIRAEVTKHGCTVK